MSIVKARGEEAAKNAEQKGFIKLKDILIKVAKGDSVRVRVLGPYDYAEYDAHALYGSIYTRPCIASIDKCPDCEFVATLDRDDEEQEKLYQLRKQPRYLMVFGVLGTGELGVFDASKAQFRSLKSTIEKYSKPDEDGEIGIETYAFDLTRSTGDKTTYSLELVPKMSKKDQEAFAKFDGVEVPDDFFDRVLQPRPRELMIEDLHKAGLALDMFQDEVKKGEDAPAESEGAKYGF